MGNIFESVIRNPVPAPPRGIIYGSAGVGKSTFAGSARDALVVDCENGIGSLQCQRTPFLETWDQINEWLIALERNEHGYKAVAVDTVDWLIRRMEEHVNGHQVTQTLMKSHGGYGSGKMVLKNYVYQILLPLLNRIGNRGIVVVLLAHARRTEITDVDGITVEKTTPDLPPDLLNTFVEWADFVCLAKLQPDGKRVLVTGSEANDRALVKNRYSLPPVIDLSWPAFIAAVGAGLAEKFKKEN
ncbi:MAG: ATP-binding protein [Planctomycetota bacterium]|jgi:hypothetical protein|nr:ATP-binding protein [Planctomycetota bacterium]